MDIIKTSEDKETALKIVGRLDTATAPELEKTLLKATETESALVLDFSELEYVSSAGLRALLVGLKAAKAKSKTLKLRSIQPAVMEVLEMTGFSKLFTIV